MPKLLTQTSVNDWSFYPPETTKNNTGSDPGSISTVAYKRIHIKRVQGFISKTISKNQYQPYNTWGVDQRTWIQRFPQGVFHALLWTVLASWHGYLPWVLAYDAAAELLDQSSHRSFDPRRPRSLVLPWTRHSLLFMSVISQLTAADLIYILN